MPSPRGVIQAAVLLGLVGTISLAPVAGQASATPAPASLTSSTSDASAETKTITDPKNPSMKIEVTPGDSSAWRQGDIVRFHLSGLKSGNRLKLLGTCPGALPEVGENPPTGRKDKHVLNPDLLSTACASKFPTGILGGVDLTGDTPALSSLVGPAYARPDGTLDVSFRVGLGLQQGTTPPILYWNDIGRQPPGDLLTCDKDHACTVVVQIAREDGSYFTDASLAIAPGEKTGFDTGSCTGLDATKTLTATGPERMQTPLSELDRGLCGTRTSPIPVSFLSSEVGETGAGGVASVGTSADLAFIGSPALTTTPLSAGQVAVPIAVNAAAVAQTGGISSPSLTAGQFAYNPEQLPTIHLEPADVARIVVHDYPTKNYDKNVPTSNFNPLGADIAKRPGNAGLAGFDSSFGGLPFTPVTTATYGVGQNSVAISLSSYLDARAKASWVYPDNAYNRDLDRAGKPVGALSAFDPLVDRSTLGSAPFLTSQMSSINSIYSVMATKDSPNYTIQSGNSVCPLDLPPGAGDSYRYLKDGCVRFVVLDAASAASVGLTTAALGSGTSASAYVSPSSTSLQAAATAAAGKVGSKGYFETEASGAYPMTFVEYAVISTNALVDDTCAPRTSQQQMLTDFLTYATGAGQDVLPAGLAPLTPELKAQAVAAVAKIGTTTVKRCQKATPVPPKKTPTPAVVPPVDPPAASGLPGDGGGSGESTGSGSTPDPEPSAGTEQPPATDSGAAPDDRTRTIASGASKPLALQDATFSGATRTSPVSSVVGLLVLLLIVGLTAAWVAGSLALPGLGRRTLPVAPTTTGGVK